MEKLLLKVPEAADALSLSKSRIYELMASGQLTSVHCGRSRRIPRAALEEFAASLAEVSS